MVLSITKYSFVLFLLLCVRFFGLGFNEKILLLGPHLCSHLCVAR